MGSEGQQDVEMAILTALLKGERSEMQTSVLSGSHCLGQGWHLTEPDPAWLLGGDFSKKPLYSHKAPAEWPCDGVCECL